jgi:hypothetical protein
VRACCAREQDEACDRPLSFIAQLMPIRRFENLAHPDGLVSLETGTAKAID